MPKIHYHNEICLEEGMPNFKYKLPQEYLYSIYFLFSKRIIHFGKKCNIVTFVILVIIIISKHKTGNKEQVQQKYNKAKLELICILIDLQKNLG